jgi:hypothetical protein
MPLPITAKEAKQIAQDVRNVNIDDILGQIGVAAKQGDFSTRIDLSVKQQKFSTEIQAKLRALGYKVKEESGGDCRTQEAWNYMVVRWDEA